MSINSCSINEHTINTLCGSRRQSIINALSSIVVPISYGGQQQHVGNTSHLTPYRRHIDEEAVDFSTLELPDVQVTIELAGKTYSQTLSTKDDVIPVVSVYAVSVINEPTEQINITDISVKVL